MSKPIAVILTDTHLFEKRTKLDALIDCNYDIVFKAFKQSIELAKQYNLPCVFHLGDFFDSRKHQSQDLQIMFYKILELFEDNHIKLVLLTGNHDRTDYRSEYSFLYNTQGHNSLWLIPAYDFIECFGVRFHMLSYFDNDIYLDLLKNKVYPHVDKTKKNVLLTHIGIHGVLNNSGEEVDTSIKFADFDCFDKTLVGHYHDPSYHKNNSIIYIGSTAQLNFGENQIKGIFVLNDDLSYDRIPTEFPKYIRQEIQVKDLTTKKVNQLAKDVKIDHIKVVITGPEQEVEAYDRNALKKLGLVVEKKSNTIVKEEIDKKVDKFDNITLQKQFDTFCKKNGLNQPIGQIYLNKVL